MSKPPVKPRLSARRLAACQANLRKAQQANRRPLSPARRAALAKATEANRRNFRLTPARLKSMGANIRKAQAASVRKFTSTERRRQANRANLSKAWATPRSPASYARSRFNHLKHGLQTRTLEETITLLGEDVKEFERHLACVERAFAPQDELERRIIRRLAEALWRRLRLYRAQARWESDRLKASLAAGPLLPTAPPEALHERAMDILQALVSYRTAAGHEERLLRRVEHMLLLFLRKRLGKEARAFRGVVLNRLRMLKEFEEEEEPSVFDRLIDARLAAARLGSFAED
jgi:hypothetical protein